MVNIDDEIVLDSANSSILVVDDDAVNLRLLEKMLRTVGYTDIICTQDPTQAVTLFRKHKCDLILLDIDMPELDGYGVMEQLNIETANNPPPILVLTAQHMQSYKQRALDSGARDYVTKPFNGDELLSRVRNLLEVQIAHKYIINQKEILEQEVKRRTNEIQQTQLQVVRKLGKAAEYRDEETGLHIIRMSKMAALLAKAVGMSNEQCDLLLNAAPMHDIGKIGIPDQILRKPGKLDSEEWTIMQTHAQIGADILSGDDSELMIMAHDIALSHHEKWNGEGYPNGLAGEEIPLVGRLCALADVFDALTSERPYKKAWSVDKAVELIKTESGKHFDPQLVDLLDKNLSAIIEIKEKHAEPIPESGLMSEKKAI